MKKLAIVTTHPIQYNAPWFRLLAQRKKIEPKVFYTWGQLQKEAKYDPGFAKKIAWDIPVLEGYNYTFVENISNQPGTHHFNGINNPGLLKEIEKWMPDAILVFGWNFKSHLHCLRYFHKKIPVLFRGDSTLLREEKNLKRLFKTLFLKWVYRHVDYAMYVGTNNKLYFERHGLKEHQLVYAPHAVDNERFSNKQEYFLAAQAWKKELGITQDELTILFAGKLESIKDPGFIIELANQVKELPVKFIIVGNGNLEKNLKQDASGNSKIIFIDFQNQSIMPVVYRLGDVFILTSKSETWGLGANEAMSSGCALILSETVGGAIDLVEVNLNGIIFQKNDINKCVRFLKELLQDKNRLNKMKEASIELIKDFSFDRIVKAVENVCSVLPGKEIHRTKSSVQNANQF